jgi:hypothetical protein
MIATILALALSCSLDQPEVKKPGGLTGVIAEAVRLQKQGRAEIEYFRQIQRAHEAWQADQTRRARDLLDSVQWEPRGWEWFYVRPSKK